ncbi:hypothetical protein MYX77_02930 [Acidobacteriia bacterium AH_259_A11_L15]|nr:hypothetical protein [Acidobacteriia bacterium AH_259_A11_L15]
MRLRLTKVDEFQFLTCFQHQLWGSRSARFKDWKPKDYLVIIVDKAIAALAEVSDPPFLSKERIWDNGLFPHRIPIKFPHAILPENRPPILGEIRDALTSTWGPKYGWGILNQNLLEESAAQTIIKSIRSRPNDIAKTRSELTELLAQAKQQRDAIGKTKAKVSRPRPTQIPLEVAEPTGSRDEVSAHTRAQEALIRLGAITGCSVWIATNDRNKIYRGKRLGHSCLRSLPNLGLNEEATSRISLIDVIWIRQNAPLCAFEVETTTSVYSGLLRMADLLALVPALNIKLFIVAPKERQNKVMTELARPTFQKIGLSDFCRFVPTEKLEDMLQKVSALAGHIQPSIVDSITIQLEEEVGSALE